MNSLKEKPSKVASQFEELASIIKRLGNPISTILLDTPCKIFRTEKIDGFVGYQQLGKCAVVIGDPVCWPDERIELYKAFQDYCIEQNLRIIHILASKSFAHWAVKNGCCKLIQAAEELTLDPLHFKKKQKLRWKINQAIQFGVEIKEYKHKDTALERDMQNAVSTWLEERKGPQVHLGDLNAFIANGNGRIFYGIRNGKVIGLVRILPLNRFKGWVMTYFFSTSEAPTGTTEHLICNVIDTLAEEKCRFFCLGATSRKHLGEMIGLNFIFSWCADLIFRVATWFFKLEAKRIYLNKYNPDHSPLYLLSNKLNLTELMALKKILNVEL